MKTNEKIALFLGAVAIVYVSTKRDDEGGIIFDPSLGNVALDVVNSVQKTGNTIRGMRNNNPGNIRKTGDAWRGLSVSQTDSAFFQFESMHYGIRALAVLVRNYTRKYRLDTVRGIISRWAPANENDTGAYVRSVSAFVGVGPDDYVNTEDPTTLALITRAIIRHENGPIASALINDATILNAIGDMS